MLLSGAIGIVMRRKLYKIQKAKLTRTLKGPQSSLCDCPLLSTFILYFNQCFCSIAEEVENDFENVRDAPSRIPGIVWSTQSMFSHSDGRFLDIPNIANRDGTKHMFSNETATLSDNPNIAMPDLSS